MKKITTILTAFLLAVSVFAQSPEKMSYQTVIRNASGVLVNGPVGVKVSILQGSSSGVAVFSETHTLNTNANGLASLEISTGTNISGSISGIDWADGPYFIKTETDPAGGTNYTITATTELNSVPYALHSKGSWIESGVDLINPNTGNVAIGTNTPTPGAKLEVAGNALVNGLWIGKGTFSANGNVAVGTNIPFNTGAFNTAVGTDALYKNVSGEDNAAFGVQSQYENQTGNNNISSGTFSLYRNVSGSGNTAIGNRALETVYSGSNNTALGNEADVLDSTLTNATAIGYQAKVGASNSLVLGSNANVGIGTSTPSAKLDVVGSVKITDGTEGNGKVLTSDANGNATWANAGSQVGFKANTSVGQPFADAVSTVVEFDTEDFDDGNNYNPATNTFTVPSTGMYHFDMGIVIDGGVAGSQSYFYIEVNGSSQPAGTQTLVDNGKLAPVTISANLKLNAGDQVKIATFPYGANNSVYFGVQKSYFSGYKVY